MSGAKKRQRNQRGNQEDGQEDDPEVVVEEAQDSSENQAMEMTGMMERIAQMHAQMQHTFLMEQMRLQAEREERREELEREREERRIQDERAKEEKMMMMMSKRDEEQRKHEREMLERQMEREASRRETDKRRQVADRLPNWVDTDQPGAYFNQFERAMKFSEIPKEEWPQRLISHLTGKALNVFNRNVPTDCVDDYKKLKDALMDAMGLSRERCSREFWSFQRTYGDNCQDIARQLEAMAERYAEGCETVQDCVRLFATGKFLTLYPMDAADHVRMKKPDSTLMAANLMDEYMSVRYAHQGKDRRPYIQHRSWPKTGDSYRGTRGDKQQFDERSGVKTETKERSGVKTETKPHSDFQTWKDKDKKPAPFRCYTCNEPGHRSAECPRKVLRVTSQDCVERYTLPGKIFDMPVTVHLDSQCSRTIVDRKFIPQNAMIHRHTVVKGYKGPNVVLDLAKVTIHVGDKHLELEVAVDDDPGWELMLGKEVPFLTELLVQSDTSYNQSTIHAIQTRNQKRAERDQQKTDNRDTASSGATPTNVEKIENKEPDQEDPERQTVTLGDIYQFDSSIFTQKPKIKKKLTKSQKREQKKQFSNQQEGVTPNSSTIIEEQQNDPTLQQFRDWADRKENGCFYKNRLLMQKEENAKDETLNRIVVPAARRKAILQIAHGAELGGHLGHRKTLARIRRHFTWPGCSTDVKNFCSRCPNCQKAAKAGIQKAPLQPMPVIGVPFQRVAFDLVGPLPRTTQGNKYLLTCMDYASKYPEAVPIRKVDAETVATAMIDIFSRLGLPEELLTDQGSVFTGRLMQQLCCRLGIQHLRTSPYHPQTDGMLERFHGTLKSMIRKTGVNKKEWDALIPFLLFAYRDTPHAVTGFTPFELLFGRHVRGPLAVLKSTWTRDGDDADEDRNVLEWVTAVGDSLRDMAQIAGERERKCKEKMKVYYDQKARERIFKEGDLVLALLPDEQDKLQAAWHGPYQVLKKITPVTYVIDVPEKRKRERTMHVNALKMWETPQGQILSIVEENGEEETDKEKERNDELTESQKKQLDKLLQKHSKVLSTTPGRTTLLQHTIDTGDSRPIRCVPYRIAHAWIDKLKMEIETLLKQGIIEHSTSPWSSPVLPVKKKDGSIRLCVDYRRLNTVTLPDPYQMPRIEDLIDKLGKAKVLTKLDLTKGYYQVPVSQVDQLKTAFLTPFGKFQFRAMPFGLRNAPSTFQRLMDVALMDKSEYCVAYMDDVLIFSNNWEEHIKHIDEVLSKLEELGLTAKPEKCEWAKVSCTYLGHVIGRGFVNPEEAKVESIKTYKQPKTKTDLRAFLGLVGYYRRFIPDFAKKTLLMTDATKKTAPNIVQWSDELLTEFDVLKKALTGESILALPRYDCPFILQTDASDRGIGAVLSQQLENIERPIAYYSKKLLPREMRYSTVEKECLAIVKAIHHFDVYLTGRPFHIQTDHRALQYLDKARHGNGRIARWALLLQPFTFTITHRAGTANSNADGLSRQCWSDGLNPGGEGGSVRPNT